MVEETKIKIPKELAQIIEHRLKDSGFKTVDSYVVYVLRQVLNSVKLKALDSKTLTDGELSKKLEESGFLQ